jgi:hypothetical protein
MTPYHSLTPTFKKTDLTTTHLPQEMIILIAPQEAVLLFPSLLKWT